MPDNLIVTVELDNKKRVKMSGNDVLTCLYDAMANHQWCQYAIVMAVADIRGSTRPPKAPWDK